MLISERAESITLARRLTCAGDSKSICEAEP
jgi:hypothetical protein